MTNQSYLWHALALLAVFFVYAGIASAWPFHVMLIAVILVTFLYRLRIGIAWAIAGGILLDGFTVAGNGIWIFGFVSASLVVHYLLQAWFPARSLISAGAVAALGVLTFEVVTRTLGQFVIGIGATWSLKAPAAIGIHMLWAVILMTVAVGIIRSRSMRLRSSYLIR